MTAKKKKVAEKNDAGTSRTGKILRDDAEAQLARSPAARDQDEQSPEQLFHELQVHQIELETQAEELRKAKLALEESRDRFLDLYDFAPVGYLTLSDKGLIAEVNLTCATLLGVIRSKLVKGRFSKYIDKKDIDEWHWYFINVLNQDEKKSCTLTLIRSDGSTFPARLEGIRNIDSNKGKPTVRIAVSDISDIRRAEEVQLNQYSLLKGILESTGSAVFSLDLHYRYTSFNSHHAMVMKQLYGADIEIGRSIFDYQSVKEDQVKTRFNIDRALDGETFIEMTFSGEETRSRRYFEVTHSPVKDISNNVIGVAVFAQDISDRKRAEGAVLESEERYRRITEGLTDYLYTVRVQDGKVVSTMHGASCTAVTGYTAEEFAAEPLLWIRMVFDEDKDRVIRHFSGVLKGKPVPPVEHRIVRKDGKIRWVRDTSILLLDADGRLVSYDGVIKDITAEKQAEEALQKNTGELRASYDMLTTSEKELRQTIEDLNRSEQALRESGAQLRAILDATPFPIALVDVPDNNIEFWSRSALTLFGHTAPTTREWYQIAYPDPDYRREVIDRWKPCLEKARQSARTVNTGEYRITCRDGSIRICELYAAFLADRLIVTFNDITERKQAEVFRQLSADVLGILNEPAELREIIGRVLAAIKQVTNADAVGIRLRNGDDFPYFAENGFSDDFLLKENTLVARDQDGGICRDPEGNVSLECTCGLIISGKTDPKNPLFTPGGSSWTNNSFPFLKLPEKDDPRFHPRNTCIHEGYASVALIPIKKSQQDIIGILQINAFKKDCFNPDIIKSLELIAGHIGEALIRRQAEEALFKSEDQLASAIEGSGVGLWDWDVQTGKTVFNERWAEIAGYTLAELSPVSIDTWINLCHPDDLQRSDELLKKHFSKESPIYEYEARIRHKDGHWVWVLDRGKVVKWDSNGLPIRMTGTHLDITERKVAEKAVQESEIRYRTLVENIPQKIFLKDLNFRYISVNEKFAHDLGLRPKEITGKTDADLFPADLAAKYRVDDIRVMESGQTEEFDERYLLDGKETWVHTIKTVVRDKDGKISGELGVFWDITERKQAEDSLREEQQFSKLILDSLPGIFYLYTYPEHQLTRWNRQHETLLGFSADELKGKLASDWHLPELKDAVLKATQEVMDKGESSVESNLIAKDGHTIPFFLTGVRFEAQGRLFYMGIGIDITERKRAEEEVQHLTEFQQSVISNALVWLSVLDPAGKILVWNTAAAEISGYRSEEVIGSNAIWKKLYPEKEYRKHVTTTINLIISEKKYLENFETVIRTKEGNEKIISWNTKGISDATGKTADYIVIGMDVTARHRAEEQLNKTVDELRQFNNLTVDRELRMIALKQEINSLKKKAGEPEKYRIGP